MNNLQNDDLAAALAEHRASDSNNPLARRYDNVGYSVSTLNDQITELVVENATLEAGCDAWEQQIIDARNHIRRSRRKMAVNDRAADKLRAKRQIVAEAAFRTAAIDQP